MTSQAAEPAVTVALIGGDGSGKSTIAGMLVADGPGFERVYMGPSLTSASHLLPTSRAVLALRRFKARRRGDPAPTMDSLEARAPTSSVTRLVVRSMLQYSEVLHREFRVRRHLRRGTNLVFDRHILFEIWPTNDPDSRVRRVRNRFARLLQKTCRPPDLTILLLAEPQRLLDRKGETDVEYLERRNRQWIELADRDPSIVVVDANRAVDHVFAEVSRRIDDLRGVVPTGDGDPT